MIFNFLTVVDHDHVNWIARGSTVTENLTVKRNGNKSKQLENVLLREAHTATGRSEKQ